MGYLMKVYKKRKPQISRKFLQVIKDYEIEKKKQMKNKTCKGKKSKYSYDFKGFITVGNLKQSKTLTQKL